MLRVFTAGEGIDTRPIAARCGTETFPALTGIRAVAAYLVFWHHYPPPSTTPRLIAGICAEGHVGVTIFFVLSGLLITHRYRASLEFRQTSLLEYLWNRVARIYPLYFAILTVTLLASGASGLWDWLIQCTLLKGFLDDYKFMGVGQAWSLTVEETFYVSAPLLFLLIRRRGIATALLAVYAMGGLCLAGGLLLDWHGLFGNFRFVAAYTFFGRAFEFLAGAWLAMRMERPRLARLDPSGQDAPTPGFYTYAGLGGMLASVLLMYSLESPAYVLGLFHPVGLLLNNIVLPVAIVAFFHGLIEEDTYARRLLAAPLAELLGKSSYAFYLLHMGVIAQAVRGHVPKRFLFFIVMNVLAVLAYKCFEEPVNRWLKAVVRRGRADGYDDRIRTEHEVQEDALPAARAA